MIRHCLVLGSAVLVSTWLLGCSGDDADDPSGSGGSSAGGSSGSGTGGSAGGAGGMSSGGSAGTGGAGGSSGSGGSSGTGGSGGIGGSGGSGGSGGPWSYAGVPYPTDMLPSGIMPTLPTPNTQAGWPYDPCTLPLPAPSGGANEYVVSTTGDDSSAGNSGKGTMAAPRRTIPKGTFPAGTHIFIEGANTPYGSVDFNIGDADMTFNCTEQAPCFVVGTNGPRIGYQLNVVDSSHVIFDGLKLSDAPGGSRPWPRMPIQNSKYVTQRNLDFQGSGQNSGGGQVVTIDGSEFVMSYRISIHDIGTWQTNSNGADVHGWRPSYRNRYLWLIDSSIYHMQADSIQTGNSSNPNPQADTSHYIWIAGNEFYENYENALDNKNSYHVVFSSNKVHDYYPGAGASGSNGTAIILSNNSEGPWTGYHWAINNLIWNTTTAIRDSGSEANEKNYAIGNVIHGADTAFIMANNAANRESWFINNSVSGSTTGSDVNQPGSNSSIFIRQNVFHNAGSIDTQSAVNSVLTGNVLFNTSVNNSWDMNSGNLMSDPLLAAPGTGNMTPMSGSPAIGAGAEDPVYALFTSLYGPDIRVDINGTPRPSGGWDIGGVEVP